MDLCTGSGALALALAAHRPDARVLAVEDSPAALEFARRNAVGTGVEVVDADVTTPGLMPELDGRVDLLVSNPPYIPDAAELEPEVAQHDPAHALFGGPDGMAVIGPIVGLAARWLRDGACCGIEHDDTTSARTAAAFAGNGGFTDVTAHRDLAGRPALSPRRGLGQAEVHVHLRGAEMTEVFDCSDPEQRATGIASAVSAVKGGRLVVMPTDTVYGIGADAFDADAVGAFARGQGPGRDMPVGVLVGSWTTIDGLVYSVPRTARELIRAFWPGALSLVVHQAPSLQWDLGDANGSVMLRMPLHPVAIELLREVGPMAVSSANVSGRPAANTVTEARDQLGDLVETYLDGGPSERQAASTIVDLTGAHPGSCGKARSAPRMSPGCSTSTPRHSFQ